MKTTLHFLLGAAVCSQVTVTNSTLAAPAPTGRTQWIDTPDSVPDGLSGSDWSSIRQQYERHRHAAVPMAGGHQAHNPGQQWQTRFDGRGFITKPDAAGWQWGLELKSYGFAGQERTVTGQPRVSTNGQRVTYDWDETLQEWFVNDTRGLEHGFTVRERPTIEPKLSTFNIQQPTSKEAEAALGVECSMFDVRCFPIPHPLTFTLIVRGGLRPEVQADRRGVRFVDVQDAEVLTYAGLTVFDADGRKLPARFETVELERGCVRSTSRSTLEDSDPLRLIRWTQPRSDESALRLVIDERGARYPLTIDPIAQQAYLKASNTGADDQFGLAVAVSGDTVVVGAGGEDSNATGVNGNQNANSALGSGAVYVFVRDGSGNWTQQAYIKASNTGEGDFFGFRVAVSGDTLVVGAPYEASSATGVNGNQNNNSADYSGAAYVFVRNGTNWSQQAYLKASNTEANDSFGFSVSVSGDTVVVGAQSESSGATGVNGNQSNNNAPGSGAAYIFVRNGTNWNQQAYLKASNTARDDIFGDSVAVSGDTVVVGARQESNRAYLSGAAYVFIRSGTNWTEQAYLKASNAGEYDGFGLVVAVSGDMAVVGAPYESSNVTGVNGNQSDNSAESSGAAYVFVRNGTIWTQQAYLKASNTDTNDNFGYAVAVSGDTVVVGAVGEDSNATGVNGEESDNSALYAGAAYVFVRSATIWTQQAYLKASNTGAEDVFGWSVAVSGDTVVVGAYGESSNTTGVNGNQSANSAIAAGAAYVFTGLGLRHRLTFIPEGSSDYLIRFDGVPTLTYRLERAPSITGPWDSIATNTAPASGLIEFHDTNAPPDGAFYRTVTP